ncbi:MAG: Uma2 family endonuclease [Firmicutes bacterium]|nr:Uma2 family endonuclease [Bacillota bacterium]
MNVKELKAKKNALGISNKKLAEASGVPIGTVQKVFSGETESPRYQTLIALEEGLNKLYNDYLATSHTGGAVDGTGSRAGRGAGSKYNMNAFASDEEFAFHEKAHIFVPLKRQGEYTVDDYMALPDENGERYELIDGVIYDLVAPTGVHQHISGFLYHTLSTFRDKHPGPCLPIISPYDVKLGSDNKTVVQPDVLIKCKRSADNKKKRSSNVPVFVAEVLSPSTKRRDQGIKQQKYVASGVREYWIIDPEKETVIVYDYTDKEDNNSDIITIYTFDDKIPVAVWDGKCKIDFSKLKKQIEEHKEILESSEQEEIEIY